MSNGISALLALFWHLLIPLAVLTVSESRLLLILFPSIQIHLKLPVRKIKFTHTLKSAGKLSENIQIICAQLCKLSVLNSANGLRAENKSDIITGKRINFKVQKISTGCENLNKGEYYEVKRAGYCSEGSHH